jgi:protein-tyrosine phosphatase
MIDSHIHILPGLDDGAKDRTTAIQMLMIASARGTTAMIATPHVIEGDWLPDWQDIVSRCQLLQAAARQAGLTLELYPGAEVALQLDILERIPGPGDYCINGGRYLLTELPGLEIPSYTEEFFFKLQTRGITPVLAHPERHPVLARYPEILAGWISKGILAQMNGPSITGRWGERVRETAELFLTNGLIHLIGSDAHSTRARNPDMQAIWYRMIELIGEETTKQLFVMNALQVLQSRAVEVGEIGDLVDLKSTNRWQRLLKKITGS